MSSRQPVIQSLFRTHSLDRDSILHLIKRAFELKKVNGHIQVHKSFNKVVLLAFFEASTRTRLSFDIACQRLGVRTVLFQPDQMTSVAKGESMAESLKNVLAMQPDLLVIRFSGENELQQICQDFSAPIVNAGEGLHEHPTQALLDAMTIMERRGRNSLAGERVLYVGDVAHSRVANSGLQVFQSLGAEVAVCGPKEFWPNAAEWQAAQRFESLAEAAKWCTVCMGLRIQKERHQKSGTLGSMQNKVQDYSLTPKILRHLGPDAVIMHPGPFVAGEDLDPSILSDARVAIYQQVTNGVYLRMSVIGELLGLFDT